MLDWLIHLDQQLLLLFNGMHCHYADHLMTISTRTTTWIPFFVAILVILYRITVPSSTHAIQAPTDSASQPSARRTLLHLLLLIVIMALVVLIADRVSSGICKPLFHRFRPSHEPALEGLVHLVNNSRGGTYGFFSSHAANTFGVALFITLLLKNSNTQILKYSNTQILKNSKTQKLKNSKTQILLPLSLFLWAMLCSYSRIYLGRHYPGDILCGALFGMLTAYLLYRLYRLIARRYHLTLTPLTDRWCHAIPLTLALTTLIITLISALH